MAHFAEIDSNNVVLRVVVVDDSQQHRGQEFLADDVGLGGTWVRTSYNTYANTHKTGGTPFRKNYACVGYTYDSTRDAFLPPKPFASWILNEETCQWGAPVPRPTDGYYKWNEQKGSWEIFE